jgi:hypothetical protein
MISPHTFNCTSFTSTGKFETIIFSAICATAGGAGLTLAAFAAAVTATAGLAPVAVAFAPALRRGRRRLEVFFVLMIFFERNEQRKNVSQPCPAQNDRPLGLAAILTSSSALSMVNVVSLIENEIENDAVSG